MQTIIYRMDDNKVLLHSTRNHIQYSVINHDGKGKKRYELETENIGLINTFKS